MTLDEAIKNEEEIAIQQIEKANALDNIPLFGMSKDDIEEIKECYKCSKEHEQLAEWLKDYKRLLEQKSCTDAISRQAVLNVMRKNHRTGGKDIDGDYIEGDYKESLYDDVMSLPSVNLAEQKWKEGD